MYTTQTISVNRIGFIGMSINVKNLVGVSCGTAVFIGAHHTKLLGMRCFCVSNKVYHEVMNVNILSMGHLASPLSLVCITPCHLSWLHPR